MKFSFFPLSGAQRFKICTNVKVEKEHAHFPELAKQKRVDPDLVAPCGAN